MPCAGSELLAKQSLSVDNLITLHSHIQFENLMPRYTATVSPCWSEIQQEQQQRRHPQHLQHQGEATQHTRTWKLQTDW
jgi:baculoviral IAP repeat-containing protein 6